MKLKATTDCPGNLTSELCKASPSDTASGSSPPYFTHIVKVKLVLTHLITVLTKHACQHNSFWGSRCVSSHAPTISLKPVLFTAISALFFGIDTSLFRAHFITSYLPPTKISYFLCFGHIFYQTNYFRQSS